jgi:hypothetical protein
VLDYLDDLESDFSVLHRVDDMYGMPADRFFRFAVRLPAYDGVMTARISQGQPQQQRQEGGGQVATGDGGRQVGSSRAALSADPVIGQLISWGTD